MAFGFSLSLPALKPSSGGGGGVSTGILLSNGIDFLLLENGDYLLQG
ncbi:hypothetical protein UFOVP48_84 [uncultured Caudovirales phage]|uniref:Uncharacterized protein n=1 Tax=uncultured Caudovirales phage TaxID=2100421 RepID=A0A6J5KRG5_9CAUD|nr:hypothetical protein UFOVP48_84 [uncultured Caudovirales phage]